MAMPTSDQIVSKYLFNSDAPPSNLVDERLIRAEDKNGDPIFVNADEYMTVVKVALAPFFCEQVASVPTPPVSLNSAFT